MNRDVSSYGSPYTSRYLRPSLLGNPTEPCPELLTEDEAIRYLRLDTIWLADCSPTLRRYRQRGLLRGTQISKRIFYRRVELDRFLERLTVGSPC